MEAWNSMEIRSTWATLAISEEPALAPLCSSFSPLTATHTLALKYCRDPLNRPLVSLTEETCTYLKGARSLQSHSFNPGTCGSAIERWILVLFFDPACDQGFDDVVYGGTVGLACVLMSVVMLRRSFLVCVSENGQGGMEEGGGMLDLRIV
jgi:hypothetical protein